MRCRCGSRRVLCTGESTRWLEDVAMFRSALYLIFLLLHPIFNSFSIHVHVFSPILKCLSMQDGKYCRDSRAICTAAGSSWQATGPFAVNTFDLKDPTGILFVIFYVILYLICIFVNHRVYLGRQICTSPVQSGGARADIIVVQPGRL